MKKKQNAAITEVKPITSIEIPKATLQQPDANMSKQEKDESNQSLLNQLEVSQAVEHLKKLDLEENLPGEEPLTKITDRKHDNMQNERSDKINTDRRPAGNILDSNRFLDSATSNSVRFEPQHETIDKPAEPNVGKRIIRSSIQSTILEV